jgi:hypothetical protein
VLPVPPKSLYQAQRGCEEKRPHYPPHSASDSMGRRSADPYTSGFTSDMRVHHTSRSPVELKSGSGAERTRGLTRSISASPLINPHPAPSSTRFDSGSIYTGLKLDPGRAIHVENLWCDACRRPIEVTKGWMKCTSCPDVHLHPHCQAWEPKVMHAHTKEHTLQPMNPHGATTLPESTPFPF